MSTPNPILPSPSQLYRRAAGIEQKGKIKTAAAKCVMCCAKLPPDARSEPVDHNTFNQSFNNKLDMPEKGDVVCGDCLALWNGDFMQKYSKSYANENGVFKLASSEDMCAFILTPPTVPLVAIYNTRKQQHMIWRTPVCMNQDVLIVRLDDELLCINRKLAIQGVKAWQTTLAIMKKMGIKGVPATLNATLSHQSTGEIRSDVMRVIPTHSTEGAAAIETLCSLRMPEWWVLNALKDINLDDPESWPKAIKLLPLAVA